ncbi:MAG: A/G-specific adenine glycosylase [Pirellulales bacterium]|nr:A/G-specific adenine glycosylase [Pirellulales bacterium]
MTASNLLPLPDAAWRRRFRERLRRWYARHARDLPWRRSRDPYRVWVSEIMLQQTQVATVQGYFERFIAAFPNVTALAEADEEAVLRLWEGLGYYRRARQMREAARAIVLDHAGRFPTDRDAVRALPGIGRYTAGAILSIALDAREPILEANTIRLFCRLLALPLEPQSKPAQEILWAMAESVLPRNNVGTFNQALMELGSEVCRNRTPRCDECPVAAMCSARAESLVDQIPATKPKAPPEPRHEVALLIRRRGRVLLLRQPDGGRWAGLWDFPRFQVHAEHPDNLRRELIENTRRQTGLRIEPGERLTTMTHGVTRYRITLDCYEAKPVSGRLANGATTAKWLRRAELDAYPLSTTGRKLCRLV